MQVFRWKKLLWKPNIETEEVKKKNHSRLFTNSRKKQTRTNSVIHTAAGRWVWLLKCDDQQLVKENWFCWHLTQPNVFLLIVLFRSMSKNIGWLGGSGAMFERVHVPKSFWRGVCVCVCLCASVLACARLVHLCCWPLGVQLIPNYLSGGWHHLPPSQLYTEDSRTMLQGCCDMSLWLSSPFSFFIFFNAHLLMLLTFCSFFFLCNWKPSPRSKVSYVSPWCLLLL